MSDSRQFAIAIFEILFDRFNESELQTLCFYLKVDYEDLGGVERQDKARELVKYFERRNELDTISDTIQAIRKDISPINTTRAKYKPSLLNYRVVYDSRNETPPLFRSFWEFYSTVEGHSERIKRSYRAQDGLPTLDFIAYDNEDVGANRPIPSVFGRVDFEYKAISSEAQTSNTIIYVIPAQLNWLDPKPHQLEQRSRVRFAIPEKHIGDNNWHKYRFCSATC